MIELGRAPVNASVPHSLVNKNIWDLDVDDPIWAGPALYSGGEAVPQWMYNTIFKAGIQAVIQLDCCKEESKCLELETHAFIGWVADRFDLLNQVWYKSANT